MIFFIESSGKLRNTNNPIWQHNNWWCIRQSKYFKQFFYIPVKYWPLPNTNITDSHKQEPKSSLSQLILEPYEVELILKGLPLGKASGPDGINNRFLMWIVLRIVWSSEYALQLFPSHGILPSIWKDANVCPIFKSGDPSLANNYRPISLLNTIGKAFERIVFSSMTTS